MRTRHIELELKNNTIIYQKSNSVLKIEVKYTNYTINHFKVHNLVHSQCHITNPLSGFTTISSLQKRVQ